MSCDINTKLLYVLKSFKPWTKQKLSLCETIHLLNLIPLSLDNEVFVTHISYSNITSFNTFKVCSDFKS